jgi:type VI secretion system secreted protein VgrG
MRILSIGLSLVLLCAGSVKAQTINKGTAGSFAVLGSSTVTNTGPSVINGDLGLYPGTSITGFPPGTVNGTVHDTDATAMGAQAAALSAYNVAAGLTPTDTLTEADLGGLMLTPGVYAFSGSAIGLTGPVTLDFQGLSDTEFVFQIDSAFTTASASSVVITDPGQDDSVFWQVGSTATLGATTAFYGNILADQNIILDAGATIACGSALSLNGAVTLSTNTISTGNCLSGSHGSSTPEPATPTLLALGFAAIAFLSIKRSRAGIRKAA